MNRFQLAAFQIAIHAQDVACMTFGGEEEACHRARRVADELGIAAFLWVLSLCET